MEPKCLLFRQALFSTRDNVDNYVLYHKCFMQFIKYNSFKKKHQNSQQICIVLKHCKHAWSPLIEYNASSLCNHKAVSWPLDRKCRRSCLITAISCVDTGTTHMWRGLLNQKIIFLKLDLSECFFRIN